MRGAALLIALVGCGRECPVDGEWAAGAEFASYDSSEGRAWAGVTTSTDTTCAFGDLGLMCWTDLPTAVPLEEGVSIATLAMSPAGSWAAAITTDGALLMFDPANPSDGANGFAGGPYKDQWAGSSYRCQILEADDAAACGLVSEQTTVGPVGVAFLRAVGDDQGHFCGLAFDRTVSCWDDTGAPIDGGFGDVRYDAIDGARGRICAVGVEPGPPTCFGADVASLPIDEEACAPPSGAFSSVALGDSIACALDDGGGATCWIDDKLLPMPVDTTFQSLSVSFDHACGIDADAQIVCFGKRSDAIRYLP